MNPSGFISIFLVVLATTLATPDGAMAQQRGGFLAQLFGNGQNNRPQATLSARQRNLNKAAQTALNFFAFDAGAVDGIFGRKSRAAARAFQSFLGYEPTGRLEGEQYRILVSAYNEIAHDNEALALKVSLGVESTQALLQAYVGGTLPELEPTPDSQPEQDPSMRAVCINIQAAGPVDLLKGQFCNLRQLSLEHGRFLLETSLNGQAATPVINECQNFSGDMQPWVAQVATQDSDALIADLDLWIQRSGATPEKLARLAQTCLGLAYEHDDAPAAMAALLALSALKNPIYIEMTGYHLALGLAEAPADAARAQSWMKTAATLQGDDPVALTAQSGDQRLAVLADVIKILDSLS